MLHAEATCKALEEMKLSCNATASNQFQCEQPGSLQHQVNAAAS
jgi:hypothetical protein